MTKKDYLPEDFDIFIGLDVDKKKYVVAIRDHDQKVITKSMPSNPGILINYISNRLKDKRVICAYETGPTGFGLYDSLIEAGIPCLVVSPLAIPKAKNETSKTNKIDAKKIAEYLQYGKLYSIRVPMGQYRELRHLVRVYQNAVTLRKKTKQKIKALLLQESLASKEIKEVWSVRYERYLRGLAIEGTTRFRLDMLLNDLEHSKVQLKLSLNYIKDFCSVHSEIEKYRKLLQSIPGIGFITSFSILGIIGDPLKLANIRQLASFAGMIPWENSTGDVESKSSITHMGNGLLRILLIESAWITIRIDTRLNQFFHRIKKRNHPKGASKKAIVAVARKMTHIIYQVLTDEREYVRC